MSHPRARRGRIVRPLAALTATAFLSLGVTPAFADATPATAGLGPRLISDGDTFISELHYDNDGSDTGEAVEVQAPVGTDLTGWSLVFYNGNGGSPYATADLAGVVGDSGVVVVEQAGIQNGSPDGLALVDDAGTVVELLSYEGELTAVGVPPTG
ncbi:lamin tail domain-containing protein [Ruania alba]|uniref:Lamin Tail Domain n=1 Tax=Ruania alba TaxID=648782 RepID=A0A1H5KCB4_9MICO|nr:lamin tail domain-containing protein [Ruania alba]SEE62445.1 Lamin Tail Domain [Ruania alba]